MKYFVDHEPFYAFSDYVYESTFRVIRWKQTIS